MCVCFSAACPVVACDEESPEEEDLQGTGGEDHQGLCEGPPGYVVQVGLEQVLVTPPPRAGVVIVPPHVEHTGLQLHHTVLRTNHRLILS